LFDHPGEGGLGGALERQRVVQVVAGVPGQPHLGEDGEVDAEPFGLGEQVEGAVGVERGVGDPEVRAAGRDAEEAVVGHRTPGPPRRPLRGAGRVTELYGAPGHAAALRMRSMYWRTSETSTAVATRALAGP